MEGGMTNTSRRAFLGKVSAGAATLALRPVFSPGRLFGESASSPAPAAVDGNVHVNYNESPYGPSERALKAIRDGAVAMAGRYYEDDSYEALSNALANLTDMKRENIQVGAGSTEILKICDDVFLRDRPRLVVAEP